MSPTNSIKQPESFGVYMAERFQGEEEQNEGIQAAEAQNWMEWIYFLFGTLFLFIKLLQVESPKGTFIDATPIPRTIVINTCDLLAR